MVRKDINYDFVEMDYPKEKELAPLVKKAIHSFKFRHGKYIRNRKGHQGMSLRRSLNNTRNSLDTAIRAKRDSMFISF